jgi:hypothetical protein
MSFNILKKPSILPGNRNTLTRFIGLRFSDFPSFLTGFEYLCLHVGMTLGAVLQYRLSLRGRLSVCDIMYMTNIWTFPLHRTKGLKKLHAFSSWTRNCERYDTGEKDEEWRWSRRREGEEKRIVTRRKMDPKEKKSIKCKTRRGKRMWTGRKENNFMSCQCLYIFRKESLRRNWLRFHDLDLKEVLAPK